MTQPATAMEHGIGLPQQPDFDYLPNTLTTYFALQKIPGTILNNFI